MLDEIQLTLFQVRVLQWMPAKAMEFVVAGSVGQKMALERMVASYPELVVATTETVKPGRQARKYALTEQGVAIKQRI